jgi:hypothetical protein
MELLIHQTEAAKEKGPLKRSLITSLGFKAPSTPALLAPIPRGPAALKLDTLRGRLPVAPPSHYLRGKGQEGVGRRKEEGRARDSERVIADKVEKDNVRDLPVSSLLSLARVV